MKLELSILPVIGRTSYGALSTVLTQNWESKFLCRGFLNDGHFKQSYGHPHRTVKLNEVAFGNILNLVTFKGACQPTISFLHYIIPIYSPIK